MPAGPYSYALLDPPFDVGDGTVRTVNASQIDAAGDVLGTLTGGGPGASQPFLYADGTYTPLAVPGASSTTAAQLGAGGQVVGRYTDGAGTHAFVFAGGAYSEIAAPGADFTTALQVSPGGKILVEYFDSAGLHPAIDDNGSFTTLAVPGAASTAVRATSGGPSSPALPAVNDAGQAIGSYTDAGGSHAFLYDGAGGYTTLAVPGGFNTTATEINAAGQVLGTYSTAPGTSSSNQRSFVYSDGTYATVAVPGAASTTAAQINGAGQVAGTYYDGTATRVFLDTDGNYITVNPPSGTTATAPEFLTQLTEAGDVLATGPGYGPGSSVPFVFSGGVSSDASVPGAATTSSLRLNDAGQLVGSFYDGTASHAFLATPIVLADPGLLA